MTRLQLGYAVLVLASAGVAQTTAPAPPRAVVSVAPAAPERLGPPHEGHTGKKWVVLLRSDPATYGLQHWACYDASHAPHAVAVEGQIGMTTPGGGNWYHNGFFNFALDTEEGRNWPLKAVRALDSGERGSCEFVWELPQAWVRVRFFVLPGKQPLFCTVTQVPRTERPATLRVRLVCYPSGYFHQGQRVCVTARQTLRPPAKATLDPAAEWSTIFYDEKYDRGVEGGVGGCGAITVPALVGKAAVSVGSYGCTWELETRPGGRELRFAFWSGLELKNEKLVTTLTERFGPALTDLQGIDPRPLRYDAAALTTLRGEFERLPAETPDSTVERAASQTTMARAEELRQRATAPTVDIAAEDDYLKALDQLDALLWQLRMKWVFAD